MGVFRGDERLKRHDKDVSYYETNSEDLGERAFDYCFFRNQLSICCNGKEERFCLGDFYEIKK